MSRLYDLFTEHPCVSTDSRRIEAGSLFFALRGASFDGNRFAADALARGAAYAVVDDPAAATDRDRTILVPDVLAALQELAREHRRELGLPILAITGSNGKTTTKELVSRVLAERFEVYATRGNLNNHIGVPLTLLAMTRDTEFGIVEMGASACGEIALLCSIAEPNYGLITNIGRAHLEGFGGPEGVRRGKGELFDYLAENGGRAFVAVRDDTLVAMAVRRDPMAVEYYSAALGDGVENHLEGDYNRANIAAAIAVGRYFDVDEARIRHAIASYRPDNNRSQRTETERNTLVVDCYNANPSSMRAALANFRAEPLGPRASKVLILGDMLELGAWSEEEHAQAVREACEIPDARILLVGGAFAEACEAMRNAHCGGKDSACPAAKDPEAKDPTAKDPAAKDPMAKDPSKKAPETKAPAAETRTAGAAAEEFDSAETAAGNPAEAPISGAVPESETPPTTTDRTERLRLSGNTSCSAPDTALSESETRTAPHTVPDPLDTERIVRFRTRDELSAYLAEHPVRNALVLIKGSRGIGLEKIVGLL